MKYQSNKAGSALILVIFAMVIVISITLSSSVTIRLKQTTITDMLSRSAARSKIITKLAVSTHSLILDTNKVDSIFESWANSNSDGYISIFVEDEESKVNLNTAGTNLIMRLIMNTSSVDRDSAEFIAENIIRWRTSQKNKPEVKELFLTINEEYKEIITKILKYSTVHGDGKININTVSHEVFVSLIESITANESIKRIIISGFDKARVNKIVLNEVNTINLSNMIFGDKMIPTGAQYETIDKIANLLNVKSSVFRLSAECRSQINKVLLKKIECVYNRDTKSFYEWSE